MTAHYRKVTAAINNSLVSWQEGMQQGGGWNAVFLCNHDQPRAVSRFGCDGKYHKESAKMLGAAIHMLRGTPYIYQGEELGMTNADFKDISEYKDVESLNYYKILLENGSDREHALKILAAKSRDNGRTPMQWNSGKNAGFTDGDPWIGIPDNYRYINAETERNDPDSVFSFYKRLVELRKEYDVISDGEFVPEKETDRRLFVYRRRLNGIELIVICNLTEETVQYDALENYRLLLGNYHDESDNIRPYEARILIKHC